MRVLVTGGTGLVGKAIEAVVTAAGSGCEGEEWFFASSKDGNLVDKEEVRNKYELKEFSFHFLVEFFTV